MSEPNVPPPPSYTPPPPPGGTLPPPPGGAVSPNRTIMLVLAYLGPLALIPYIVEKNDPEVQWHAKHGLVLTGLWFAICILLWFLVHIPFLGWALACVSCFVPLVILAFHVYLIVQAVNGKRVLIPGISELADRF
ncbi:MAG: hypothetical protein ACJ76N_26550 [Thermoanaerobaculia bacterium]